MKICCVAPWFPSMRPGTSSRQGIFLYRQTLGLSLRGHQVIVISVRWQGEPDHERLGDNLEVYRIPYLFKFTGVRYPILNVYKLYKLVKEVCLQEKVDLIEFATQLYLTTLPIFFMGRFGIPAIVDVYGIPGDLWRYGDKTVDAIAGVYQGLVGNRILKAADGIMTENRALCDYFSAIGIDAKRVYAITKGVDIETFKPMAPDSLLKSELGIKDGEVVVLYVGRLDMVKGVNYLLEAAKSTLSRYDNVRFLIVGDGSLRHEYEKSARALFPKIVFTGWREDVPQLMNTANMFVLSSLSEGAANVVMEASASGLPVIATEVGEVPQIVAQGETGLLVKPKDVDGLVKGIETLLANPSLARKMGEAGRQRMVARYSQKIVLDMLEKTYRETIDRFNCSRLEIK